VGLRQIPLTKLASMKKKRKYRNVHDDRIILLFSGELNFELQASIVSALEKKIDTLEADRKIKKKFYNVATECIQNLLFHTEEVMTNDETLSPFEKKSVTITAYAISRFFVVQTSNYVPVEKQPQIQEKLDFVNSKTEEELKESYKSVLENERFSEKGTAGLGYIDIVRKSKQKLRYEFFPLNADYSLFTLTCRVLRS